jgi:hypothetical protein
MIDKTDKSVMITVRLSKSQRDALAEKADELGLSVNSLALVALFAAELPPEAIEVERKRIRDIKQRGAEHTRRRPAFEALPPELQMAADCCNLTPRQVLEAVR